MDEQVLQMLHMYNGELLNHEKAGNPAIWHNMDGPWGPIFTEINQIEKDKYHATSSMCRI